MEEVKTSIEKMLESFDTDNDHSTKRIAGKHNYNFLGSNNGSKEDSIISPTRKRRRNDNETLSISDTGDSILNDSNQWEMRILKADLIEANTKVIQLKKEVDERVHLHKQLEQLYDGKLKQLQTQLDAAVGKNEEFDKIFKYMRKQRATDKENYTKLKNEMMKHKQNYDDLVATLHNVNHGVESNARETIHGLNTQISSLSLELTHARSEIEVMQEELNDLRLRNEELSESVKSTDVLTSKMEVDRCELESAQRKIEELEADLKNYQQYKNLSEVFQERLAKVTTLEHDNERLKQENKNLHQVIGNKLLLEEQVHDLKTRLKTHEASTENIMDLQTRARIMEAENNLWKKIASEYCPSSSSPHELRAFIDNIQKKHVILASDVSMAKLEKSTINDQMQELKKQNEFYVKANEQVTTTVQNYKALLGRMQKKLALVAKERDSFKNLLESHEKDLVMNAQLMGVNADSELKSRLEIVEKTFEGYKEICANLEKDLEVVRNSSGTETSGEFASLGEQHEHFQKELKKLQIENERLQRRKDELELLHEQFKIKEAFFEKNVKETKVVHLADNPADVAAGNYRNELDKLRAEVERLKAKIRKMEAEHEDLTTRLNETTMSAGATINIQEMNALRSKIQSLESKQQRYKEIYRAASLEFREVIYMLFGYRVDRIGNNNYRISNMYAENEDEYLNFRLNEMGELDMLETNYSLTLADMVGNFLAAQKSMPAFLSSLTLELFNRSTNCLN